jgi:hypothetical protein
VLTASPSSDLLVALPRSDALARAVDERGELRAHGAYSESRRCSRIADHFLSLQSLETIPKLAERLGAADASTSDAEAVVRELDEIRSVLFRPERMRVSVTGDVLGLKRPRSDWVDNLLREKSWQPVQTEPVPWSSQVLTALGKEPAKKVKADGTLKMQLLLMPPLRVSSARCLRSRARTRSSRPRASAVLSSPTRPRSS